MIGFIIGIFVGGFFGVALMCCLSVASRSDDQMQIPDGKEEYQHHDSSTQ